MLKRRLRIVALSAIGVVVGVTVVSIAAAQPGQQSRTHTTTMRKLPTCAESAREVGRDLSRDACKEPPTAPPGATVDRHGPFRLIPAGYAGDLTSNELPLPANRGVATNDIAVLRQSSIFAEPSYLPGGFRLMRAETKDATSEIGMVLTYEGPHGMQRGSIELLRARMATDVIDIIAPTPSANVELQRITIRGAPALILVPKPGTEMEQIGFVTVWMVRAGVKTVISAHGISAQDARLMAESIP